MQPKDKNDFDAILKWLREMPESERQERLERAHRRLDEIPEEDAEHKMTEEELAEDDRKWEETLNSPESIKFLEQLEKEHEEDRKKGRFLTMDEFLILADADFEDEEE